MLRGKAARYLIVSAAWSASACGGASSRNPTLDADGGAPASPAPGMGGETGLAAGEAGAPSGPAASRGGAATGSGGAGEDDDQSTGGGAAGASRDEQPPLIDSGSRFCEADADCLGLRCLSRAAEAQAICATSCDSDAACPGFQGCFGAVGLAPMCLTRCIGIVDCPYAFDCFDPNKNGEYWCIPAPWTRRWDK